MQLRGQLYEQSDGVAMGSPLGLLLANVFMCSIEETLEREGKMPTYYRRYVDDTLTIMPNKLSADNFLGTLNNCHSSIKFTMEIENDGMLPFLGTQLLNKSTQIQTKVYVKPTNTGLLLHYKIHVDDRYKRGLLIVPSASLPTGPTFPRNVIGLKWCFPDWITQASWLIPLSLVSLLIKHLINQLPDYQLLQTGKIQFASSCRLKTRLLRILYEHNSMI